MKETCCPLILWPMRRVSVLKRCALRPERN